MRETIRHLRRPVIALFILLFSCNAYAVDIPSASKETPLQLDSALEIYKASNPNERLGEILRRKVKFDPAPADGVNFGFTHDVYWYRLKLHNAANTSSSRVLEIAYPPLDFVDVYIRHASGRWTTVLTGDQRPISKGQIHHRFYAVPIQFAANEALTVYLRVKTEGSHQLPVQIWPVRAFMEKSQTENIVLGLFFGMLIMMALYNGFVGLSTRDSAYVVYLLVTSTFALLQANLNGYAYQYLTPALELPATWINITVPVDASVCMLSVILFARVFLDTPRTMPRLNIAINILMALLAMVAVAGFLLPYRYSVPMIAALAIPASITCIAVGFVAMASGNRLARFYLLGWSALLLGIVIKMTELFGILPTSFFTAYAWQIGLLVTVMLLSMALSDRINLERKDKIDAQDDALRSREQSILNLGRYQRIVENVLEGVFESDVHGSVLSANAAVAKMLRYDSAEQMINSVTDLRVEHVNDPQDARHLLELLTNEGQIADHEVLLRRRDNSTFWATISMRMIRDEAGKTTGFDGIIKDISERREKQKLQQERVVANAASAAKSEFLAKMSHELRTPMNAVIGFTDLALKTNSDTRRRDHLRHIDSASHSLLNIINDILDLSKVEAGKLSLESRNFELGPILDKVSSLMTPLAADKGLEIIVSSAPDVPVGLIGDALRLEQVLINLMGNAIKFTERGEIELRVAVQNIKAGKVDLFFTVRDTGIGLTEEQSRRLFQPFSQADGSTTRKYGGTGLGLAICKQLVELMDGKISVQSIPDQGSTFAFNAHFSVAESQAQSSLDAMPSGLRVLIVDDNAAAREVYGETLRAMRLEVVAVDSAEAAFRELAVREFDAALIDWQMPDVDGLELTQRIRDNARTTALPIVLMTAYGQEELTQQAQNLGVAACLEKPIKPSPLLEALLEAMGTKTPGERQPQLSQVPDTQSLAGVHILLTEDNVLNQRLASEILTDAGASLDIAGNGRDAIEALQNGSYDLVLMDVQMPVMDGLEATRHIRKHQGTAHIPIIAMTANAMESDRDACLKAGMDDFLPKPINASELLELAAKYLPLVENADKAKEPNSSPNTQTQLPKPAAAQTSTAANQPLGDLPGIEIAATLKRIGGRRKLLIELLHDFVSEQKDVVERIRAGLAAKQIDEVARIAHTIKGLAANCGCTRVAEAAATFEVALKQHSDNTDSFLVELQASMLQVAASVAQIPLPTASMKPATAVVLSDDDLSDLEARLRAGDFSLAEDLAAMTDGLNEHLSKAATESLCEAVRRYDYEAALAVLQAARAAKASP